MRTILRQATAQSHANLDALVGSLDLAGAAGFVRFLKMHYVGLHPIAPIFARFVERELGLSAPDYVADLCADLAALGVAVDALPRIDLPGGHGADAMTAHGRAGITYVVAGSRLGMTMLRRMHGWESGACESETGNAMRYVGDTRGLAIWRALLDWMDACSPKSEQTAKAVASAQAAFAAFHRAFEVTVQELC